MKTHKNKAKWASTGAIVLLAGATAFFGWDAYQENKENDRLEAQVTEMETQLEYNALETQKATEAFAQIEGNLAEIRKSEGYLLNNLNEEFDGERNSHKRILAEITTIETMIADNKGIIANLEKEVGQKDGRINGYKKSVASLEKRISDYKTKTDELVAQAAELKKNLANVQEQNADLSVELSASEYMVHAQAEQLEMKDKQLRTAYYVTGPFKYLKEINVAEKEGGIFGIASAKTVADDLDRSKFTEIDIYHYTVIPIYGKDAKLLSNHDKDSYKFVRADNGDVRWMNITDPERFWENTKYLVVEAKGSYYDDQETALAK